MPSEPSKTTLVNFRCSPIALNRFDGLCDLAGKSRTQVLIEMMQAYVASASATLSDRSIGSPVRIDSEAISRPIRVQPANLPDGWDRGVQSRGLRRFSEMFGFGRDRGGLV
jgi:hypothetical protein